MSLNRRRFLARSGQSAAGLALGIHQGSAWAARSLRADEPVPCALIGAGGRGTFLMDLAMKLGQARIVAISDVNEKRLGPAVKAVETAQGHAPAVEKDYRRLLENPAIAAVIVATPHHWHTLIALRAIEAGKHIYLEKPASHVFQEGRLLANAAAKSSKVVFQHGTQMRSSPVTKEAAKVLASGILGEIKMAKAWGVEPRGNRPAPVADAPPPEGLDWNTWLGPAPQRDFNPGRFGHWNDFRDYGNGEIGGDGIHDIDMARWGLGVSTHPVKVTAHGSQIFLEGEGDFPDNMMVVYQYAEKKVLIYENRNFAPYPMHGWDNGNLFYGTKGYMVFSRRGYFQTFLGAKEEKGPGMEGGAGNEEHIAGFFQAIRQGSPSVADAEVAHLSCGLVHLGEIAYRLERVLHFDPKTEQFKGDDQANAMLTKNYREPFKPGAA